MSLPARLLLIAAASLLLAATPREFTREELKAIEAERDDALRQLRLLEEAETSAVRNVADLESDLIAAAMESRRREQQAAASERKLIDLSVRLRTSREDLVASDAHLEDLMASLAVSGRHRPPALIATPGEANEAIRAAIVMGATAPLLNDRTEKLTTEITQLKQLEAQVRREQARLEANEARLALKKAEIEKLVATKRVQFESVSNEAEALRSRVQKMGAEAKTLRQLLVALETAAPSAPGLKPAGRIELAAARQSEPAARTDAPRQQVATAIANLKPLGQEALGGLLRPANGLVSRSWGQKLPGGEESKGLYIQPRADSGVVAPVDGTIEYAGMFRTYGQLLIISTSDGYHVLLSGMSRIYGTPGQTVKAGEPVGRMPNREIPPPELYLEVRKAGEPMNPARWMKGG